MAGDIEAANGMHPDAIIAKYLQLIWEIKRIYSWTPLILVGHTIAGSPQRRLAVRRLNNVMQHLASNERNITFIDNYNSRLKDNIHLSHASKESLGRRITEIIKKPHLDAIRRFR